LNKMEVVNRKAEEEEEEEEEEEITFKINLPN
jgi:hypothetical protein